MELVDFLRARLDEDEAIARRACEYAEATWKLDEEFGETVLWWPPEPRIEEKEREHGLPVVSDEWRGQTIESGGARIAPHIARHDPARALAEVEAKRAMVDDYERTWDTCAKLSRGGIDFADVEEWKRQDQAVQTLKPHLLRQTRIHRGHPDFDPAWLDD